jgi:hypothetical protein
MGHQVWTRTVPPRTGVPADAQDMATSAAFDRDGNLFVISTAYLLTKFDPAGRVLFRSEAIPLPTNCIGEGEPQSPSIQLDGAGHLFAMGYQDGVEPNCVASVVRVDATSGAVEQTWADEGGANSNQALLASARASDGTMFALGEGRQTLIAFSPELTLRFRLKLPTETHFDDVAATPDNGAVLVGNREVAPTRQIAVMQKYAANGSLSWTREVDVNRNAPEQVCCFGYRRVEAGSDGTIYAIGSQGRWDPGSRPSPGGLEGLHDLNWIEARNSNGRLIWQTFAEDHFPLAEFAVTETNLFVGGHHSVNYVNDSSPYLRKLVR